MTASTAECGCDVGWGTVDLSSIKSVDLQSLYGAELSFMSIMHPKFNIYWYHSNCRPNLSSSTPCMKGGEMKERKGEGWKRGTCSPPPSRRCCRFVSISRHGHRSIGRRSISPFLGSVSSSICLSHTVLFASILRLCSS